MNKGTGKILHFGSEAVGWMFGEAKKGAGYVGSKVVPKGVSEAASQNFLVKGISTTVKTTVDSVGNIVGGANDGVCSAASGARKGAHEVIEHRYGSQVGGITSDTVQSAVNCANIYSIPEDQAIKTVVGNRYTTSDDRHQKSKSNSSSNPTSKYQEGTY
jgi:hypothetical protein